MRHLNLISHPQSTVTPEKGKSMQEVEIKVYFVNGDELSYTTRIDRHSLIKGSFKDNYLNVYPNNEKVVKINLNHVMYYEINEVK